MYQILKKNKEKTKYFISFTLIIFVLLLIAFNFQNDKKVTSDQKNLTFRTEELDAIKKFLLSKIRSPFINKDYTIKSGDTIQKILKEFKIKNKEIGNIINQYGKYAKPNELFVGNIIELVVKKSKSGKNNSISKFSVPVSKSITIEITKNEEGKNGTWSKAEQAQLVYNCKIWLIKDTLKILSKNHPINPSIIAKYLETPTTGISPKPNVEKVLILRANELMPLINTKYKI